MDFVSLDVETANPNLASICQVGIVEFLDGEQTNSWEWLVDPEDYFAAINVFIHGIDAESVKGQSKWPSIHNQIAEIVQGKIVVSHTAFDRTSMHQVIGKYQMPAIDCSWLDSARVVRRTWPALARAGYSLSNVAKQLGINFEHHNAKEDAKAAGEILVRAIRESGIDIGEWLKLSHLPIGAGIDGSRITKEGNPAGPLFGEVMVFTGALSMPRAEAAHMAADAGCEVAGGVTKKTTLLVVGDQDIHKLAGHEKSSKHRKAEEMIGKGKELRILGESDFKELLAIGA